MGTKQNLNGIAAAVGLIILIFDSHHALEGAKAGVDLCLKTAIPSLFPFFILSSLLTTSLNSASFLFVQRFAGWIGIPPSAAPLLIPAFLGGYPVGAKCISDLFHAEQIDRQTGERLLAFCSNAGPSFLFGVLSSFFPRLQMVWALWLIHIVSAILTALVIPDHYSTLEEQKKNHPGNKSTDIMTSALKAIAIVCGWVILFRVIISYLHFWGLTGFPEWLQVLVVGILELTNGCCALEMVADIQLRFILCSCMLSWGGICVLMQTVSVTKGLSPRNYITGKLLQTAFSFLMSCGIMCRNGWIFMAIIPFLFISLRRIKNRCGNIALDPV